MVRITILNSLGFFFLDFLIPYVATLELNASGTAMGFIFSVRFMGYILVAPMVGALADKISPKLMFAIGSWGRGLAYFILYGSIYARSITGMLIGNILLGIMAGFFWIPLDMLISMKSHQSARSEAFGRRSRAMGYGTLFGALTGFSLLGYFNAIRPGDALFLYSPLLVFGVANVIAGTLFLTLVDQNVQISDEVSNETTVSYLGFLRNQSRNFLVALFLLFTVMFLGSTNSSISKPFIIVVLTNTIESDPIIASAAFIPSGIASMLLAPNLGKLADRIAPSIVISVAAIFGAITTYFLINTTSLIIFAILLIIDTTLAISVGLVVQNVLSRISAANRGKIFGLQTIFTDFGSIIGPVFGGIFWDAYGYKFPFYFSIGVEILLIPVFILAIIKIRPHLIE